MWCACFLIIYEPDAHGLCTFFCACQSSEMNLSKNLFSSVWTMEENSGAGIKPHYALRHGPVYRLCLHPAAVQCNVPTPTGFHASSLWSLLPVRTPTGAEGLGVSIRGWAPWPSRTRKPPLKNSGLHSKASGSSPPQLSWEVGKGCRLNTAEQEVPCPATCGLHCLGRRAGDRNPEVT